MEDRTKNQKNVSNVTKDGLVEISGAVEVAMSECDEVERKEDDRVKFQRPPSKKEERPAGGTLTIPGRRAEEREEGLRTATRRNPERKEQREESFQPATSKRHSTSAPLFPEETGDQINDGDDRRRTTGRPGRCHRCHGYGHVKRECKGPDLTNACWKCGTGGHRAKDCTSRSKCFLCARHQGRDIKHTPGSGACEEFRTTLKAAKDKTKKD